ncbi:hypothetical protein ACQV2S_00960 [Facklamia sp. P13064]|uniref:hypothetical protein n=1 Tax=Facklamia sp. P13064 TaxID=3421953 RepID=UPI003D171E15
MRKSEFKEELFKILDSEIEELTYEEKIDYICNLLIKFEIQNDNLRKTPNKGKSWTDEELKIILLDAPTRKNCLKYARIFKRGYGSIEQIYRWSTTATKDMTEERKEDSFIKQIKRVSKEIGLRG